MPIPGFRTLREDPAVHALVPIANEWTRRLFDGTFYRSCPVSDLPATSLVFVQSRGGNTVADNPATLGGGHTDLHLVYEGLSRVDADGVLSGAATARGERTVFSVWHPQLIDLRAALGHPRHPAQIVVTDSGQLPIDRGLMFQVPELRVIVITKSSAVPPLRQRLHDKPWVEIVDAGDPVSMTRALRQLAALGIKVVSAVGGRRTATALLRERLVSEIYLTTSPIEAGEPNTPFYDGAPPKTRQILVKAGVGPETGVTFEHLLVSR